MSEEQLQEEVKKQLKQIPRPTFLQMLAFVKDKTGLGDASLGLSLAETELKLLKNEYSSSINPIKEKSSKSSYIAESKETFSSACIDILDKRSAIGWTSSAHTGSPVPVFVMGKGENLFYGRLDNTVIPKIIEKIALTK